MPSIDLKQVAFNCITEYFKNLTEEKFNEIRQSLANRILPQTILDAISGELKKINIEARNTLIAELYKNQLDELKLNNPTQLSLSMKAMTESLQKLQSNLTGLERELSAEQLDYISATPIKNNKINFNRGCYQRDVYVNFNYYIDNQIMPAYQNELRVEVGKLFNESLGYSEGWHSNHETVEYKIIRAIKITTLSKEIAECRDLISTTSVKIDDLKKLLATQDKVPENLDSEALFECLTTKYKSEFKLKILSSYGDFNQDIQANKSDIFNIFVSTAKTVSMPGDISNYICNIESGQSQINRLNDARQAIITRLQRTDNMAFSDSQIKTLIKKLNELPITAKTTSIDFEVALSAWMRTIKAQTTIWMSLMHVISCTPNDTHSIKEIEAIFQSSLNVPQNWQPNFFVQEPSSLPTYMPVNLKPV